MCSLVVTVCQLDLHVGVHSSRQDEDGKELEAGMGRGRGKRDDKDM